MRSLLVFLLATTICQADEMNAIPKVGFSTLLKENSDNTIAGSKLKDNAKLDFAALFALLEERYGPLLFKTNTLKIQWQALKADTLRKAGDPKLNVAQVLQMLADFLFKFNDAHVSVEFPSTLQWSIPLGFRNFNDHIVVRFVSKDFPEGLRAPELNDELLSINGMTVDDFRHQFSFFNAVGNELTNKSFFAVAFAKWSEARGLPLSMLNWDHFDLTLKSKNGETYALALPIKKVGMGILDSLNPNAPPFTPPPEPQARFANASSQDRALLSEWFLNTVGKIDRLMRTRVDLVDDNPDKGSPLKIGGREPDFKLPADFKEFVPPAGKIPLFGKAIEGLISADFFKAGTFNYKGKRIGYLRVPSYEPDKLTAILPSLRYFIRQLDANSDVLVLDQRNNPGGLVVLSDWLIAALMGPYQPERHLRFAVKPSLHFLQEYRDTRNTIATNEDHLLSQEEVNALVKDLDADYAKIYQAWQKNENLSEPVSMHAMGEWVKKSMDAALFKKMALALPLRVLYGMDVTQDQTYTRGKRILMLTNELDFSGGDATPAGIQDYGGLIIGTRTAGAGGTVEVFQDRGFFESTLHFTTSMMVRPGGRLVENYGVTPDISLPLELEELDGGNYLARVLTAAKVVP